jgi:hypothetical protein
MPIPTIAIIKIDTSLIPSIPSATLVDGMPGLRLRVRLQAHGKLAVVARLTHLFPGQSNFRFAGETFFPSLEETVNLAD